MKRFVFLVFVLLFIINPSFKIYKKRKIKGAVLVDLSRSMKGNIEKVKKILPLFKNFDFYGFSDDVFKIDKNDLGLRKGLTDMFSAIEGLKGYEEIFLISDGIHNKGKKDFSISSKIHSIYVGEKPEPDAFIKSIEYPDYSFLDSNIEVFVGVDFKGFLPEEFSLYLKEDGKLIKTFQYRNHDKRAVISFKPERTGRRKYEVILKKYPEERNYKNNSKVFYINILPSKIRVLYICGRPGWEYRFLRRFLKSNPRIELVSFIILRNPEDVAVAPERELSLIPFPSREIFTKEIYDYNLFILENFDYRRFFPSSYLENVVNFVLNGGGFLLIGGENFSGKIYKGTALEKILPVKIGFESRFINKSFKVFPVAFHPITGSKDKWKDSPTMQGLNVVEGVNGKVLLKTENGNPYIVIKKIGSGRVACILGNTLWRLSFIEGKKYFYWNFWKNLIYWLLGFPSVEEINIEYERRIYRIGEECVFYLKGKFEELKDTEFFVFYPDKRKEKIEGDFDLKRGRIFYRFTFDTPGKYRFFVKKKEFQKSFSINVKDIDIELEKKDGNPELLKWISDKTGGRFFNFDDIKKLEDFLKKERFIENIYPFRSLYFFLFLVIYLVFIWIRW